MGDPAPCCLWILSHKYSQQCIFQNTHRFACFGNSLPLKKIRHPRKYAEHLQTYTIYGMYCIYIYTYGRCTFLVPHPIQCGLTPGVVGQCGRRTCQFLPQVPRLEQTVKHTFETKLCEQYLKRFSLPKIVVSRGFVRFPVGTPCTM